MTDTGDHRWDNLTRREKIIWIAAFLEGEGCFLTNLIGHSVCPQVEATQVREEPLTRIISVFGGGLSVHKDKRPAYQDSYRWYVGGEKAVAVCCELLPFLSPPKRIQARTLIAFRYNCPALRHQERPKGLSDHQKKLRKWYVVQMKELKRDPFKDVA